MTTTFGANDPTAVVGRRFVAAFIDYLIGLGVGLVLFIALHDSYQSWGVVSCTDVPQPNACFQSGRTLYIVEGGKAWLLYAVWWGFAFAMYVVLRGLTGKTPGTALMGLVVVDGQGKPPGIPMALVRSVTGVVDYLPCCVPLVGMITIGTTKGHRRVGDMAARTYCVGKASAGHQVVVEPGVGTAIGGYGVMAGQPQWGQPGFAPPAPGQPGYGQPPAGQPPVSPPATAAVTAPGQPQWDPQRNAYVQWDPTMGRWLRFDPTANQWVGLDDG